MNNIIKRKWNQNSMVIIEDLQGMAFQAESGGHTFQISGIDGEGNAVALSGTPAGVMLRADGQDVALTCSVSGGVVSATLPANAYSVPGRFGLTIFLTSDGQKTAIYAAVGTVGKTSSGTVAPPAGSDVVDLVNAIAAAVATIPASYSALLADIAPTYSNSALYSVGQYAWYDGDLKRCIVPITTAESYTAAHWTSAVLGQDVSDLKSAFNYSTSNKIGVIQGYYDFTTGAETDNPSWCRTAGFIEKDCLVISSECSMNVLAFSNDGTFVGVWTGSTFTPVYASRLNVKKVSAPDFLDAYPNYKFAINFSKSGTITPNIVLGDISVININELKIKSASEYDNLFETGLLSIASKTYMDVNIDGHKFTFEPTNATETASVFYDVFDATDYYGKTLMLSAKCISKTIPGDIYMRSIENVAGSSDSSTLKTVKLAVGKRAYLSIPVTKHNSHILLGFMNDGSQSAELGQTWVLDEIQLSIGESTKYSKSYVTANDVEARNNIDNITNDSSNLLSYINLSMVSQSGVSTDFDIEKNEIKCTLTGTGSDRSIFYDAVDLTDYYNQEVTVSAYCLSKTISGDPNIRLFEAVNGTTIVATRKDLLLNTDRRTAITFKVSNQNAHLLIGFMGSGSGSQNWVIKNIMVEPGAETSLFSEYGEKLAKDLSARQRISGIEENGRNLFSFERMALVSQSNVSPSFDVDNNSITFTLTANGSLNSVFYDVFDATDYYGKTISISAICTEKTITGISQLRIFEAVNGSATPTRPILRLPLNDRVFLTYKVQNQNAHLWFGFVNEDSETSGKSWTVSDIQIETGNVTKYFPIGKSAIDHDSRNMAYGLNQWKGKKVVWLGTSVPYGEYSMTSYAIELAQHLDFTLVNTSACGEAIHYDAQTGGYPGTALGVTSLSIEEYSDLGVTIDDAPLINNYNVRFPVAGTDYNMYWRTWEHIFTQDNADADMWVLDVVPNNTDFSLRDWNLFDPNTWSYTDGTDFVDHRTTYLGALLYLIDKIYALNPDARIVLLSGSAFSRGTETDTYVEGQSMGYYENNLVSKVLHYNHIDLWGKLGANYQTWKYLSSNYISPTNYNMHPSTYAHELMGRILIGEFLSLA